MSKQSRLPDPETVKGAVAKRIIRSLRAGFSPAVTADRTGIPLRYVHTVMRRVGAPVGKKKRKTMNRAHAHLLREAILARYYVVGPQALAEEFGTTRESVRVTASRILPASQKQKPYPRIFDVPPEKREEFRFFRTKLSGAPRTEILRMLGIETAGAKPAVPPEVDAGAVQGDPAPS
jgi:hypothetical protein